MSSFGKIISYRYDKSTRIGNGILVFGSIERNFTNENIRNGEEKKLKKGMIVEFEIENERIKNIRPLEDYFLPSDTKNTVNINEIDNFNLLFNKYSYFDGEKFVFYKRDRANEIFDIRKKVKNNEGLFRYISSYLETVEKSVKNIKTVEFSPNWRMIVGLGSESVYEVSITLHHIYGFPYIPGQTVKGITRHWGVVKLADELVNETSQNVGSIIEYVSRSLEKGEITKELFEILEKTSDKEQFKTEFNQLVEIFGTQNQEGKIIFFDAMPLKFPELDIDIMNPHYAEYYSGKKPPADYLNPTPIFFITVGKNSKFSFSIGTNDNNKVNLLETAFNLLKESLSNHGIGAKTSLGYGVLNENHNKLN